MLHPDDAPQSTHALEAVASSALLRACEALLASRTEAYRSERSFSGAAVDADISSSYVVAAGAGVVEASHSVVASGTFVGTGREIFLAGGGVVGAASSSAKGRGDVSDAGTAAARTP